MPETTHRKSSRSSSSTAEGCAPASGVSSGGSKADKSRESTKEPRTKEEVHPYEVGTWCFDSACNRHIVGDKRYFVNYRELDESEKFPICSHNGVTEPEGVGTVEVWWKVLGKTVSVCLDDAYYVKGSENLVSHSKMEQQGFKIYYDTDKHIYTAKKDGVLSMWVRCNSNGMFFVRATNEFVGRSKHKQEPQVFVNFALSDGVEDLQRWHERLGHMCPQHVQIMADRGLVDGLRLQKRVFSDCEPCHLGKQKARSLNKELERGVKDKNQLMFADLFFPPSQNGSQYAAVLVILDAYTRYITTYPVKTKSAPEINALMRRYVNWAERQCPGYQVKEISTDNGGEFFNAEIDTWYQHQGIEHNAKPAKSSHLNLCERSHQTLNGMIKTIMADAGFPSSFWVDALHNAVYIKNRAYTRAIGKTPYEAMWGRRPDVHHIRRFGALAYAHTKVGPNRAKFDDNCRVGYVLGYQDGHLGCKLYFPQAHTVGFVLDAKYNEDIVYKDRFEQEDELIDWSYEAEHDAPAEEADDVVEEAEEAHLEGPVVDSVFYDAPARFPENEVVFTAGERGSGHLEAIPEVEEPEPEPEPEHDDPVEAVAIGDDAVDVTTEAAAEDVGDADARVDDQYDEMSATSDEHDAVFEPGGDDAEQQSAEMHDCNMFAGTYHARDDGSVASREEHEPKRQKTGLRERDERGDGDFGLFAALTYALEAVAVERPGKTWHISEVKLPRSYKAAIDSPQSKEWYKGMEEEMAAMEAKDVLELVSEDEMPHGKKALKTMWRYQAKTDDLGNVKRFRSRLVALGNEQQAGVDYFDTFSPVARMATLRLFVALCLILELTPYQCDINTAYLNALLKILHFIKYIPGFPCPKGMVWKVKRALYGLHQSGREWNDLISRWLTEQGFTQCTTEPCLFVYREGDVTALLLLYVDDIIVATNKEQFKTELFAKLNEAFGIKDQGILHDFLGVQVEIDGGGVRLHQTKYCGEILEKYGFADAVGCRSPMEASSRLRAATDDEEADTSFDYRGAIGSLMYLATTTRPDLSYAVGQLSRFVSKPTAKHCGAVKRVLRYLVATKEQGIRFERKSALEMVDRLTIEGFGDADWGNCPDSRKSVSGYLMKLAGGPVAWAARRQSVVAQSTAEAEYVASCEACMEGRGLANVLMEVLPVDREVVFTLGVDNQAALALAQSPTYSRKTRHIELRYHYVREMAAQGHVTLWKIAGEDNPADAFTKPLSQPRLSAMKMLIGMSPATKETPREAKRKAHFAGRRGKRDAGSAVPEKCTPEDGVLE